MQQMINTNTTNLPTNPKLNKLELHEVITKIQTTTILIKKALNIKI